MLYEVTKLSSECSHVWRASRVASAYPRDIPQVLYNTLQKNDPARRCEHYSHVYTRDTTCELYCSIKPILEEMLMLLCEEVQYTLQKKHYFTYVTMFLHDALILLHIQMYINDKKQV